MSSQIDTSRPFSEAAYGPEGSEGSSGFTGGGEAHGAAWKQALGQAKALLVEESGAHGSAVESPPEAVVKPGHPLSWDRLSMTVASMVAWNMSVELADDVAASTLTEHPNSVSGLQSHTPLEQTFREGTRDSNAQLALRNGSTGLMVAGLPGSVITQQGTTPFNASQQIMMGVTDTAMSEIPSFTNPTGLTKASGTGEQPKWLHSIVSVRDSSELSMNARLGQQRLEGIRTVLAGLETQATLRKTVAELTRLPQSKTMRHGSATGLGGSGSAVDQALSQKGAAAVQKAASGAAGADSDQTDGRTQTTGFGPAADGEKDLPSKRMLPKSMAKLASNAPSAQAHGQVSASMTTPLQAVVGAGNVEIASDQQAMVDILEVDGATIDANEVPELPVQDISHLDMDVDDPMGNVRVVMTKEAEEVAIRMETPAEVLEEYKKMEEEMAEAMASQGLNLSNFSADAQGFGGDSEEPSPSETARTSSDPQMSQSVGEQALKQSGSVSRLVNRIV